MGIVEENDSVERIIAVELFVAEQSRKVRMNKHERQNIKVTRLRNLKELDLTHQDFDVVWKELDKINDDRILNKKTSVQDMLMILKEREVCSRVVRACPPVA